ncbi:8-amino-7-oxononanoate synthase [Achromatium sp. WMS2]|nr:8-amino-7-oxononanoate synthase [Achromatium sp. WMS2]
MRQLNTELIQHRTANLYRTRHILSSPQGPDIIVDGRQMLTFCSNDYLGLAAAPQVIEAMQHGANEYGVGSGSSHLISGHYAPHQELEQALAAFLGRPRALLFSTGYMANIGVLTALLGSNDALFEDRLNHASLIDGGMLTTARFQRYPHVNLEILKRRLTRSAMERCIVATDGVFSMDGELAPLPELAELAAAHNAWLMVDDAHGFGVLGAKGTGTIEHFGLNVDQVPILMGTLGKAIGVFGAFVAGSEDLIETLIQKARSFIYTTALPPALAVATLEALRLVQAEPERREQLQARIAQFRSGALNMNLPLMDSITAIQPLIAGDTERAISWSKQLENKGILIPAIRPPTVPVNQARLRITLSASHTEEHIARLLEALSQLKIS